MNVYQLIMLIGALILLFTQFIRKDLQQDGVPLYEIFMIVGLLTIVIPPIVWTIEVIRYSI